MSAPSSVTERRVFPPEAAALTLKNAMDLYVGRGRKWSFADLETATGIPETNLRSYASGARSPTYPSLASLCGVLGGAFTARLLQPVGIGAYDIPEPGTDDSETVSTLCDVAATAAKHRADRVLDHRERAIEARDLAPILICEAGKMLARAAA